MNYQLNVDLPAYASGSLVAIMPTKNPTPLGVLLANGTTYYIPLTDSGGTQDATGPISQAGSVGAHILWDAAIIATVTIEVCNFTQTIQGAGSGTDITDSDATAGHWVQWNPVFGASNYGNTTAGGVLTNYSLAIAGGTAGGAVFGFPDSGFRRYRIKIVVGGTGGRIRVRPHGKNGG